MRIKPKPIDRLLAAMDRCAVARGEAQWTHGYRAAKGEPTASELWAKEQAQWKRVDETERAFRRVAVRLLREASRG